MLVVRREVYGFLVFSKIMALRGTTVRIGSYIEDRAKVGLQLGVCEAQFIVVLIFINY